MAARDRHEQATFHLKHSSIQSLIHPHKVEKQRSVIAILRLRISPIICSQASPPFSVPRLTHRIAPENTVPGCV
ncbi:hypothetical protein CEXT_198501 [Caerostris extrusa]|uniref:Uncharacterized protein n=1 Tax=Caerostris extrusa TaxID=172846 RepID=A0AAV4XR11_CAEEX|nr:hypothetical protein CEXT_198501 [Caerostris extrusa]